MRGSTRAGSDGPGWVDAGHSARLPPLPILCGCSRALLRAEKFFPQPQKRTSARLPRAPPPPPPDAEAASRAPHLRGVELDCVRQVEVERELRGDARALSLLGRLGEVGRDVGLVEVGRGSRPALCDRRREAAARGRGRGATAERGGRAAQHGVRRGKRGDHAERGRGRGAPGARAVAPGAAVSPAPDAGLKKKSRGALFHTHSDLTPKIFLREH